MKLWVGKEMEGDYKGLYTLFVANPDITFEHIETIISDRPGITQIYFGAGGCSEINQSVVKKCKKKFKNFLITLEIDVKHLDKYNVKLLNTVSTIITFNEDNTHILGRLNPRLTQVKLQTEKPKKKRYLALAPFNSFDDVDTNVLLGKTYKGDIVLE